MADASDTLRGACYREQQLRPLLLCCACAIGASAHMVAAFAGNSS
jgi:hypothetical protein